MKETVALAVVIVVVLLLAHVSLAASGVQWENVETRARGSFSCLPRMASALVEVRSDNTGASGPVALLQFDPHLGVYTAQLSIDGGKAVACVFDTGSTSVVVNGMECVLRGAGCSEGMGAVAAPRVTVERGRTLTYGSQRMVVDQAKASVSIQASSASASATRCIKLVSASSSSPTSTCTGLSMQDSVTIGSAPVFVATHVQGSTAANIVGLVPARSQQGADGVMQHMPGSKGVGWYLGPGEGAWFMDEVHPWPFPTVSAPPANVVTALSSDVPAVEVRDVWIGQDSESLVSLKSLGVPIHTMVLDTGTSHSYLPLATHAVTRKVGTQHVVIQLKDGTALAWDDSEDSDRWDTTSGVVERVVGSQHAVLLGCWHMRGWLMQRLSSGTIRISSGPD